MEIKGVNIKSMKYDAFNDNEYIEQLRAGGVNVIVGKLGSVEFGLAPYVRYQLLWYRIHGGGCRPLRFCPVRV